LEILAFFRQLYLTRMLILTLTIRDFKKKYVRNFFGFFWTIVDPLTFIVILYFVFGPRFSSSNDSAVSYVVYLITGYIAFELFSSAMQTITLSISEHAFLLKKVNFRVAIIPIVTMLSNLMVHTFVILIALVILIFHKIMPSWYWFQLFYYIIALSFLLISIGWLTASIYLFFPDINNIIAILTKAMFFLTPIFWHMSGLEPSDQFLLKFNPVYYIVNGYRESLISHVGFWEHPILTLYFWSVSLTFLILGVIVFKKLRPDFADVVA
jgi:ABC-type polysaccharide/polyol phosphate export permease